MILRAGLHFAVVKEGRERGESIESAAGNGICGYGKLQYNDYVNSEEWALHCVHGAHEYGRECV